MSTTRRSDILRTVALGQAVLARLWPGRRPAKVDLADLSDHMKRDLGLHEGQLKS